jgi:hypothetical protein
MIGRGLRKVDPERYPGIQKDDCIVLDFGTSILMHGSIEQDVRLEGEGVKTCNECKAVVPCQCSECPICGYAFPQEAAPEEWKNCRECGAENYVSARVCAVCGALFVTEAEKPELEHFHLSEVDLLNMSPFRWESLFEGLVWVANALEAWTVVVNYQGRWIAMGARKAEPMRVLGDNAEATLALVSADDFLRLTGDMGAAAKMNYWLTQPPSDKQLHYLGLTHMTAMGMNRYRASCCVTWVMNERGIKRRLEDFSAQRQLAA